MIYKGQKCELGGNLVLQDETTVEVTKSFILNNIVEFAKGEGIEIGMELPSDLMMAWFEHNNPNVGITLDRRGKVTSIGRNPFYEIGFELGKARYYNLIGFKDFRNGWEAKQKKSNKPKLGTWYKDGEAYLCPYDYDEEEGDWLAYGFAPDFSWFNCVLIQDWTTKADMDKVKELLLEKAKNDYPIGTAIHSLRSRGGVIGNYNHWKDRVTDSIWFSDEKYQRGLCVYYEGKWAEIVKESEQRKGYLKVETSHGTIKGLGDIELSILNAYPDVKITMVVEEG